MVKSAAQQLRANNYKKGDLPTACRSETSLSSSTGPRLSPAALTFMLLLLLLLLLRRP
jgi:hypothetical protein